MEELIDANDSAGAHASQVTALGLALFDATHEAAGVPADDRRWLEAACRLHEQLDAREAVRRLLFPEYRTILINVAGALQGEDDEALHQIRIAMRKARAVMRGFRKPLASTSARQLEDELQRINRALGLARDLDVWLAFLAHFPGQEQLRGARHWSGFVAHQRARRQLQQATVRRRLSGSALRTLRRRFDRLLRLELPRVIAQLPAVPLAPVARHLLEKHLRRALKLAKLRHATAPEDLHRLRIELRRVRFLGGFLAPVLGPAIDQLRKRAHAVERVLGDIRDSSLALTQIRNEGPVPPRLLVRQLRESQGDAVAQLDRVWPRLADPGFLRRVRRALRAGR